MNNPGMNMTLLENVLSYSVCTVLFDLLLCTFFSISLFDSVYAVSCIIVHIRLIFVLIKEIYIYIFNNLEISANVIKKCFTELKVMENQL